MEIVEYVAKARRRAVEQIDSAFTALNEGKTELALSCYVRALEEIGRAKMFRENLGEKIADAPPSSIITVDGQSMTARDARLKVAVHYLNENKIGCPVEIENRSYDSLLPEATLDTLKSSIVALKSLSAFL